MASSLGCATNYLREKPANHKMVCTLVDLRKTLLVVSMVIVVIAVVGFWFSRQPTGQVKFSINRSVIKQDENATITVIVENIYRKEHIVEYRFEVRENRVTIYEGAERPLPLIGSQYTFNFTLNATVPSDTRLFDVTGTLEEGVSSATYPISLTVLFDGEELDKTWPDLALTVER